MNLDIAVENLRIYVIYKEFVSNVLATRKDMFTVRNNNQVTTWYQFCDYIDCAHFLCYNANIDVSRNNIIFFLHTIRLGLSRAFCIFR